MGNSAAFSLLRKWGGVDKPQAEEPVIPVTDLNADAWSATQEGTILPENKEGTGEGFNPDIDEPILSKDGLLPEVGRPGTGVIGSTGVQNHSGVPGCFATPPKQKTQRGPGGPGVNVVMGGGDVLQSVPVVRTSNSPVGTSGKVIISNLLTDFDSRVTPIPFNLPPGNYTVIDHCRMQNMEPGHNKEYRIQYYRRQGGDCFVSVQFGRIVASLGRELARVGYLTENALFSDQPVSVSAVIARRLFNDRVQAKRDHKYRLV